MLIVSELTQCADRQFQLSTTRFLKLIVFHPVFWIVHSHVFCIQPTQTGKIYSLEYCKLRLKSCRFQSPLILLFRFWFQWVYHYGKFTLILNVASWWHHTPIFEYLLEYDCLIPGSTESRHGSSTSFKWIAVLWEWLWLLFKLLVISAVHFCTGNSPAAAVISTFLKIFNIVCHSFYVIGFYSWKEIALLWMYVQNEQETWYRQFCLE